MRGRFLLAVMCLGLLVSVDALAYPNPDEDLCTPPATLRILRGKERGEAMALCAKAEHQYTAYRRAYRAPDTSPPEATAELRKLEAVWKEALERVKDTDLEHYHMRRFSGVYKYRGEREKGEALIAELQKRRAAQRREREKKLAAITPELDALIRLMSTQWKEKAERDEEIKQAVAGLPDREAATEFVVEHFYHTSDFAFRRQAVTALKFLGTERARKELLDIALLRHESWDVKIFARGAAQAYVAMAKDKSDARKLLASGREDVRWLALAALKGSAVDEALLAKLGPYLQSDSLLLRMISARVLAEDPTTTHTTKKVQMFLDALAAVRTVKDPDKIWWPGYMTHAESLRLDLIGRLSEVRGADEALRDATPRLKGQTRICVLIVRAKRGDTAVKAALVKEIDKADLGVLRVSVAGALGQIGSAEDLPMLRRLAESDPLQRKQGGCMEPDKRFFPVRQAASQAARSIEKRIAPKQE